MKHHIIISLMLLLPLAAFAQQNDSEYPQFSGDSLLLVMVDFPNMQFQHSAVVYAVNGEEVIFLQLSSLKYNVISIGKGFSDGNHLDETSPEIIAEIPSLKICRSPLNTD